VCLFYYNIYLHPLASYPGPKIAAATRLWHTRSLLSGQLPYDVERLHNKYGPVVRIAPNELSYTDSAAWKEIYGHRSGQPEMPKDPDFYVSGRGSLITESRERHAHLRRMMSHGFSDKALREQEPLMHRYVDMFLKGIHDQSRGGQEPVDMVRWYNVSRPKQKQQTYSRH
jgi:cytochrome P450